MNDHLTMTRQQFGDAVYTAVLKHAKTRVKHAKTRVGGHLIPYGELAGEHGVIQYAWDSLARHSESGRR